MKNLTTILKAIADESRFRIPNLLLTDGLCVGALASRPGISNAAVSQHLQVLRKAGLVAGEKRGYWTHYTVQRPLLYDAAEALVETANRTVCAGTTCQRSSVQNTDSAGREEDI